MLSDGYVCEVWSEEFVRFGMFVGYGGQVCGTQGIRMGFVILVHFSLEGLKELVAFWKRPDPHWSSWWGRSLYPTGPSLANLLPWDYNHPHLAGREAGAKVRNPSPFFPPFPLLSWLSTEMHFLLALQTPIGKAMQRAWKLSLL